MLISFRGGETSLRPAEASTSSASLPPAVHSRYLTDGVSLFRHVGIFDSGLDRMIGLEDCHTLEVRLVTAGELRARRLRAVTPDAEER